MSIQLTVPPKRELKPRIVVFGVGGAGCNAVNNMIAAGLEGVDYVVANTDAQSLANSSADRRIQIGAKLTEGLGAGSNPEVGKAAAEETIAEIVDMLQGSHMVFVTAGMGGGTGTGAAPVIARAAREQGILTVGVVTKPFDFEGARRMRSATSGIEELAKEVDTLIIIPNQNLFRIANAQTTFAEAFAMADEVLHSGVAGITDLMVKPGLINLDFADVRTVMNEMGKAMMGTGEAEGEKRAIEAAEAAIANPLLDDVSMQGARGVLINITGGDDMTLYEVDEAANRIKQEVDGEANVIFGSTFDEALRGTMRVSVVATGIDVDAARREGLGGAHVIPMVAAGQPMPAAAPQEPETEAPAAEVAETAEAPAADLPVAAEPAAASDSELPGFLTGQQAAKPANAAVTKRRRSFIDRVFGSKKDNGPEESRSVQRMDMQQAEAPAATPPAEGPAAPLEVTETPRPAAIVETQPAAFLNELDGASEPPAEMPAVAEAAVDMPQTVMQTGMSETAEADPAPTLDLGRIEPSIEAPVEATAEATVEVETDAAIAAPAVEAKAETKTEPKAEAPKVSAPSVDAVSHQPVQANVRTSLNTGPTMTGSSFEADQLDIPAFLRR